MKELIPLHSFNHPQFGTSRAVIINGEPWWIAKDVCETLELGNVGQALSTLDDDEKSDIDPNIITADVGFDRMMNAANTKMRAVIPEAGRGGRPLALISEPGLYSLALRSRKPEAKAFKRWITHEVIPAIRRHGGCLTPEKVEDALLNPDTLIRLATELKQARVERELLADRHLVLMAEHKTLAAQAEADRPRVLFSQAVEASKSTILIRELAKYLKQNGVDIGQNCLFEWLREHGYLIRAKAGDDNQPTQKAMDMGLFEIKKNRRHPQQRA